jgi:hypothetical protein
VEIAGRGIWIKALDRPTIEKRDGKSHEELELAQIND